MNLYSHFEEKGYRVEAYVPNSDADIDAFEIRILIQGEQKKVLYLPLSHLPVFGLDVGDAQELELFAAAMMEALPEASSYDVAASAALDAIEEKFSGARVRVKFAQRLMPDTGPGPFEWTCDAFVVTAAGVLGSREAVEKWMGIASPELGNLTPKEALHTGMAREVLALLARQMKSER
jgi:hypothetical protein